MHSFIVLILFKGGDWVSCATERSDFIKSLLLFHTFCNRGVSMEDNVNGFCCSLLFFEFIVCGRDNGIEQCTEKKSDNFILVLCFLFAVSTSINIIFDFVIVGLGLCFFFIWLLCTIVALDNGVFPFKLFIVIHPEINAIDDSHEALHECGKKRCLRHGTDSEEDLAKTKNTLWFCYRSFHLVTNIRPKVIRRSQCDASISVYVFIFLSAIYIEHSHTNFELISMTFASIFMFTQAIRLPFKWQPFYGIWFRNAQKYHWVSSNCVCR